MSLDITIKERKEFYCPDCGRLVTAQDIGEEYSGGRVRLCSFFKSLAGSTKGAKSMEQEVR